VLDPTANDKLSRVRGVGRYLQTLHENFSEEFTFIDKVKNVPQNALFINPFFNFFKPPLAMRRIAEKQVAVIHDMIPFKYSKQFPIGLKGWMYLLLNRPALNTYDLIITDSLASKKDIVEQLEMDEARVQVVYPTIQKAYFASEQSGDFSLPQNLQPFSYFIYVGDATWNKNIVTIAKALQSADATGVFVGKVFTQEFSQKALNNPWMAELNEFLEITKGDKRFIFPGFVSDDMLRLLYQKAIANLLISRDEGFGLSFTEAAACKTPTIAAFTSVQQEISQEAALFAPPENPKKIVEALHTLNGDRDARDELAAKAYTRSLDFRPEVFRHRFLEVLNELS